MTDARRRPGSAAPGFTRIFTAGEKKGLLSRVFEGANLEDVDFSEADLRNARFVNTSLRGCDFSLTHLQGTQFLRCDLRGARFAGAKLESNRFDESWFSGASGLSRDQRTYIEERGGSFLRIVDENTAPRGHAAKITVTSNEEASKTRG